MDIENRVVVVTGAVIVNISSISRSGNIGQTNYAAAKAGVVAMTTTWAEELMPHGIRVTTKGYVSTLCRGRESCHSGYAAICRDRHGGHGRRTSAWSRYQHSLQSTGGENAQHQG